MYLLKTAKIQMALVLIVFAIWSITTLPPLPTILQILIAIGGCVLTDLLFVVIPNLFRNPVFITSEILKRVQDDKSDGRPLFFPSAAIVSGLIIGLISPPIYEYVLLASIAAIAIKNVVRISNRHMFNPAASGLLISSMVFNQPVSWTAAPIYLFILPALVSIVRIRKYYLILSFLFLYMLLLTFLNPQNIQNIIFDPTVLFFSLVMLPEPMTSPHNLIRQLLFGGTAALATIGISLIGISIDPLLAALLIANAVFFKFR